MSKAAGCTKNESWMGRLAAVGSYRSVVRKLDRPTTVEAIRARPRRRRARHLPLARARRPRPMDASIQPTTTLKELSVALAAQSTQLASARARKKVEEVGEVGARTELPVDDAGEAHDEVFELLAAELAGEKLAKGLPVGQATRAEDVVQLLLLDARRREAGGAGYQLGPGFAARIGAAGRGSSRWRPCRPGRRALLAVVQSWALPALERRPWLLDGCSRSMGRVVEWGGKGRGGGAAAGGVVQQGRAGVRALRSAP